MATRAQLVERIDRFLTRYNLSARGFGINAVGDHRLISRLKSGAGVTLTIIERAEAYMESVDKAGEISPTLPRQRASVQRLESRRAKA